MAEPALEQTVRNLREQVEELLSLAESARRVLTAPDLDEVVREYFSALQRVVAGVPRALYLRTEDGLDFACFRAEGAPVELGAFLPAPLDLVDWVCENLRPTTLPGEGGAQVLIPLVSHKQAVGILVVSAPPGEDLPQKLVEELTYLSGQTAAAVQNHRLLGDLRRERRSLARTSAFLNNVLESINQGIVTLDAEGKVTLVNRNAASMLEAEGSALQGLSYRDAFDADVVKVLDGVVEQVRVQGFSMDQQLVRRNVEGIELTLAVAGTALAGGDGEAPGCILIVRDMTASKELERLRALDQMKSQFVSNVSHELRTPLTSIKAYAEALTGMISGETEGKFLKVIDEESDRLLGMIEDLLNVSRIESGKFKLVLEPVDVREMLESVLAVSKVHSDRHPIVLETADTVPALVPMDRNKIKEVLLNLLNNAIKYSPEGGEVRLRTAREESNLRFDVVDRGMGLSPEDQKRLFQQFFRTEQALAAQIRGTGLGLAITKGIVEAHGGTIRVTSPGVGQGSTFTVLLPIRANSPGA